MNEYFFANYRLLTDDGIANHESTKRLSDFAASMPYTHTFTLRLGDTAQTKEKRTWVLGCPMVYETEFFTIHDIGEGWAFVNTLADERRIAEGAQYVVVCSRDYSDLTTYLTDKTFDVERRGRHFQVQTSVPLSSSIRAACEAGMVTKDGLALHASLVEKDGFGVIFLGPSGMGKSTQAKLWEKYLGADFLIGDRPCMRKIGGKWFGCRSSIVGVTYNGTALTQADATEASDLGLSAGDFVLYIKAEDPAYLTGEKSFVLDASAHDPIEISIKITETKDES